MVVWMLGDGWMECFWAAVGDWVTVGTGPRCRGAVGTDGQVASGQLGEGGALGAHAVCLCHRSGCRGALNTLGWVWGDAWGCQTPLSGGVHRPGQFLPGTVQQPWGRLASPRGLTFINISRSWRINTV